MIVYKRKINIWFIVFLEVLQLDGENQFGNMYAPSSPEDFKQVCSNIICF